MKTSIGHVSLAAAVTLALAPLVCPAQNLASGAPGAARHDVTLLTGPGILSWAHGAQHVKVGAAGKSASDITTGAQPELRFIPSTEMPANKTRGTLTLRSADSSDGATKATPALRRPNPETLRFESQLAPTPAGPLKDAKKEPVKRD